MIERLKIQYKLQMNGVTMFNSKVFKFLSISLLMYPMFSSTMEMQNYPLVVDYRAESEEPDYDDSFHTISCSNSECSLEEVSCDVEFDVAEINKAYDVDIQAKKQAELQIAQLERQNELDKNVFAIVMKNFGEQIEQSVIQRGKNSNVNEPESNNISKVSEQILKANHSSDSNVKDNSNDKLSPHDMLYEGIINDSAESIKKALYDGAINPNIYKMKGDRLPIVLAVLLNKTNAIKALLECGADANTAYLGKRILHHAMTLDNTDSACLLVKKGADFSGTIELNKNIMDKAINGNQCKLIPLELIQELINKGWDIHNNTEDYQNSRGIGNRLTNIWWNIIAHEGSKTELLTLFLKNGLDPNQTIYNNIMKKGSSWTPLLLAIEKGNFIAVKMLVEAGADINKKASPRYFKVEEHSPLSYAVKLGIPRIIEFLIQCGAQ